ncbi:MAG: adenylate/guanylate cyclase domain-containing protein [Nitrospirae bacterium]|nr:adenylate/guanylate cyclase domain-containing protein [Nitrospirota bacterium]
MAVLITTVALALYSVYPRFVEELEDRTLDLRFWIRGTQNPGPDIVIVAIDEKSLAELGRWPWSRRIQARLVERIKASGARLIGLDLFYSEPESRDADALLAGAIRSARPVVIGLPLLVPVEGENQNPASKSRHPDFIDESAFRRVTQVSVERTFRIKTAEDGLPPIKPIGPSAEALGHVYALPEPDGTLRREILVLRYGEEFFPSLPLQLARLASEDSQEEMVLEIGRGIRLGERFIPTDEYGRLLINYYGKEQSFPYYSAAEVLSGGIPRDALLNKIVLVGTSALGTYDQKITPFSNNYPGVEKNATALANILQGSFVHHTWVHKAIDLATILIIGLGLGVPLTRLKGLYGTALAAGLLAALLVWLQWMFVWRGWWLNAVMPVGTLLAIYTAITADRYLVEERKAHEIRAIFSSYVSPKIVEELVRRPETARLGGQRKELTILFSDIRGFTTFSEGHEPEQVVATLNEYLKAMTEVVFRWDGTLDKFVGDAIMVFWGAPVDQPNHAELAARCAIHMRQELDRLQEKWRAEGKVVLDSGIGINTGAVLVGNTGVEGKKMDYTVIGDHVNLAARVEGLTRQQNASILITEYTYRRIRPLIETQTGRSRLGHLELREMPLVQVKGRTQSVTVYEVKSLPPGELKSP